MHQIERAREKLVLCPLVLNQGCSASSTLGFHQGEAVKHRHLMSHIRASLNDFLEAMVSPKERPGVILYARALWQSYRRMNGDTEMSTPIGWRLLTKPIIIAIGSVLMFSPAIAAGESPADVKAKFRGNMASCREHMAVIDPSPDPIRLPRSFCTAVDLAANTPHYLASQLREAIGDRSIVRLDAAYYRLNNLSFIETVCGALAQNIAEVNIILDAGATVAGHENQLTICSRARGAHVTQKEIGWEVGDGLFHNKFAAILLSDGTAITLVSTGNPTVNSELYIDGFMIFEERLQGAIYRWHVCVASHFLKDTRAGRSIVNSKPFECGILDVPIEGGRLVGFQLPNGIHAFRALFDFQLSRAAVVKILVQAVNDPDVAALLNLIHKAGTKLVVITDDDLFFQKLSLEASGRISNEYMTDQAEVEVFLLPALQVGMNVKFTMTNHYTLVKNFIHAKMAVFRHPDGSTSAYIGSANLTKGALGDQYENVYFVTNDGIAADIQQFVEQVEALSLQPTEMPARDYRLIH